MDEFMQENEEYTQQATFENNGAGFDQAQYAGFAQADGFGAAPVPAAGSFGSSAPAVTGGAAAFTEQPNGRAATESRLRADAEAFDAKEREQKAARKSAGKATLKKLLSERKTIVDARKVKNREEEQATEAAMLDSLQGESWARVVSLIDIHGTAAKEAAAAQKQKEDDAAHAGHGHGHGKKKASEPGHGDTSRMKEVLLKLKEKPLAPQ